MANVEARKSKKGKKKGKDAEGNDVRLHKAQNAHVSIDVMMMCVQQLGSCLTMGSDRV